MLSGSKGTAFQQGVLYRGMGSVQETPGWQCTQGLPTLGTLRPHTRGSRDAMPGGAVAIGTQPLPALQMGGRGVEREVSVLSSSCSPVCWCLSLSLAKRSQSQRERKPG